MCILRKHVDKVNSLYKCSIIMILQLTNHKVRHLHKLCLFYNRKDEIPWRKFFIPKKPKKPKPKPKSIAWLFFLFSFLFVIRQLQANSFHITIQEYESFYHICRQHKFSFDESYKKKNKKTNRCLLISSKFTKFLNILFRFY